MSERQLLLLGACLMPLGIGLALLLSETLGAAVSIAGAVCMLWGLHRFGRLGSDGSTRSST
jgi:hypothetical protein